jgi:hypothetical protein
MALNLTQTPPKSKTWIWYIVIGVILIVLFGILFSKCKSNPDNNKKTVDSLITVNKQLNIEIKRIKDSVFIVNQGLSKKSDSLTTKLAESSKDLASQRIKTDNALSNYKKSKDSAVDTQTQLKACDILAEDYVSYIQKDDAVHDDFRNVIEIKNSQILLDSVTLLQKERFLEQKNEIIAGHEKVEKKYTDDYRKLNNKFKFKQVETKILAGIGAAAIIVAATVLIKK